MKVYTRREFSKQASLLAVATAIGATQLRAETNYTVVEGDTLGHIALRHGLTIEELRSANQLSGDLIRVGQQLKIPQPGAPSAAAEAASEPYVVRRGDTLGGIALSQGVTVGELKRLNQLSGDRIQIGQRLAIPSSAPVADLLDKVRSETAQIRVRTNNWKRIVVHHSAIKYGNAEVYDRAHRKRGMQNGLAYHFVIGNGIDSGDGEIEVGPRWRRQLLGGHVKSYRINLTAVGICLVGNFQEDHPTRRQLQAFTQLMDWLRSDIIPGARKFAGHRDLRGEQTICPGKNFPLAAMHARYG